MMDHQHHHHNYTSMLVNGNSLLQHHHHHHHHHHNSHPPSSSSLCLEDNNHHAPSSYGHHGDTDDDDDDDDNSPHLLLDLNPNPNPNPNPNHPHLASPPDDSHLLYEGGDEEDEDGIGVPLLEGGIGIGIGIGGRRAKRKKYRGPRSWKDKWREAHPWAFVRTVNHEERMFCTVCEAYGNSSTRNAFRKEGSSNFQPSALSTHANSSAHKNALLTQKSWNDAGKMGTSNNKARGKTPAVTEYTVIANHLTSVASKLNNVVTRDDFDALKAELRLMQRCKDARRINSCCVPTDPLMPVPTLEGLIPDNLPRTLADLEALPCEHLESLLLSYELPVHGDLGSKLRRLKAHLGFKC